MSDIDICNDYRPYAKIQHTLSLGCTNCGRLAMSHPDACQKCLGTGHKNNNGMLEENETCEICGGTAKKEKI